MLHCQYCIYTSTIIVSAKKHCRLKRENLPWYTVHVANQALFRHSPAIIDPWLSQKKILPFFDALTSSLSKFNIYWVQERFWNTQWGSIQDVTNVLYPFCFILFECIWYLLSSIMFFKASFLFREMNSHSPINKNQRKLIKRKTIF